MDAALSGKVVLITGASGGIGTAVARAFAAEGARLALHYRRNRAPLEKLAGQLKTVEWRAWRADLRKASDVARLFAEARQRFGRLDVLVASAGIWVAESVPVHRMNLAQWQNTLATDLTSVFLCCREFFRVVKGQGSGSVVLVGSTAGVFGEAGHADYAAAKAAIGYGLARTLKNELARIAPHTKEYCGGRVNCVCPGWTITPMTAALLQDPALVTQAAATMALPQLARPEDIANAVVFLASDRLARHITGQTLVVAGGMEGRWLWRPEELNPDTV
jgi:3-oxoacyl-[acyl-carrier protein] reductase